MLCFRCTTSTSSLAPRRLVLPYKAVYYLALLVLRKHFLRFFTAQDFAEPCRKSLQRRLVQGLLHAVVAVAEQHDIEVLREARPARTHDIIIISMRGILSRAQPTAAVLLAGANSKSSC